MHDAGSDNRTIAEAALRAAIASYSRARRSNQTLELFSVQMNAAFAAALALGLRKGVALTPVPPSAEAYEVLARACIAHLANERTLYVEHARDTFAALAVLQSALRRPSNSLAEVCALSIDLGQKLAIVMMDLDNVWDDWSRAEAARQGLVEGGKNRKTEWLVRFAPIARDLRESKPDATDGELRRRAERWATDEKIAGRAIALPATAEGFRRGVRKLEAAGELPIRRAKLSRN